MSGTLLLWSMSATSALLTSERLQVMPGILLLWDMSAITDPLTSKSLQVMSGILLLWGMSATSAPLTSKRWQVITCILLLWSMSVVSPILLVNMAASCICCSVMKCAKVGGWSFQINFQVMGICSKNSLGLWAYP